MASYIWLAIMVILLIIEGVTVGLFTIWFAAGALVAMVANLLGFNIFIQFGLFFVVSLVMLVFTRPFALKYLNPKKTKTNYEAAVDKTVKIIEKVDNQNGTGAAILDGQEWTARAKEDGVILEKDELAKVIEVKGVKLIVAPVGKQ